MSEILQIYSRDFIYNFEAERKFFLAEKRIFGLMLQSTACTLTVLHRKNVFNSRI